MIKGTIAATQSVRGTLKDIPSLDKTLSKDGYAADAKAVGEALKIIDDIVVSPLKTWSSQKISTEIANAHPSVVDNIPDVSGDDIIVFTTDDFELPFSNRFGDKIVNDADAYRGKAAKLTGISRVGEKHNGLNIGRYPLPLRLVNPDKTWDGISYLGVGDLITDGKYRLYKIDNVAPIKRDYYETMYMFNDESLQIPSFAERLAEYKDKEIDVYISMKITGDITFADTINLPVFYIDRIIVTNGAKELFPGTGASRPPIVVAPSRPGCYKVKYANEDEWINPSMDVGSEFKTTDRLHNEALYKKSDAIGTVFSRKENETQWRSSPTVISSFGEYTTLADFITNGMGNSSYVICYTDTMLSDFPDMSSLDTSDSYTWCIEIFKSGVHSEGHPDVAEIKATAIERLLTGEYSTGRWNALYNLMYSDRINWKQVPTESIDYPGCYHRMVTEDTCSICGKVIDAQEVITTIDDIPKAHLIGENRNYTVFSAANRVADAEAYQGYAGEVVVYGAELNIKHMYYNGNWSEEPTENLVGVLSLADMASKEGYNVYEFTYTVPKNGYTFMLDSLRAESFGMYDLGEYYMSRYFGTDWVGKTVKVYVSMKVVDFRYYYRVYVDRMRVASVCQPGISTEWINPPMIAGEEYRTTERFEGKPVYTQLIDCGNLAPIGESLWIEHGISMKKVVRCEGSIGNISIPTYGKNDIYGICGNIKGIEIFCEKAQYAPELMKATATLWYIKD